MSELQYEANEGAWEVVLAALENDGGKKCASRAIATYAKLRDTVTELVLRDLLSSAVSLTRPFPCSLTLVIFYSYLALAVVPYHPRGHTVLHHFLLLNSLMFLTRTTTVSVTNLPQPNFTPKCLKAQNDTATLAESFHVVMLSGFPPKACGDLIYSGHAACAILSMAIFERHGCFFGYGSLRATGWAMVAAAIASIFMCRSHYTVDVVLGVYFSYFLSEWFWIRTTGGKAEGENYPLRSQSCDL